MATVRSILTIPLLIAGLAVLYTPAPTLKKYTGRVDIDPASLTRWTNSSSLNNERCVVHREADACEDVKIHFASHTAFLACGYPAERAHWYPCSGSFDAKSRSEDSFVEEIVTYDIKSKKTTKLRLEGLEGDLITHGLDVYSLPGDPTKVHIFAVNHARGGDRISVFSHVLGSDVATLVKNVAHPGIKTANGVAATGPLSFYITNDHYFTAEAGPLRTLEEKFGPWASATHVQYCDASGETTTCHQVTPEYPGANGILLHDDLLVVGDCQSGEARLFTINPTTHALTPQSTVSLGAAADNINIIPTTGDITVAVFPELLDLPDITRAENIAELGRSYKVPAAAVRLRKSEGYKPELFYKDDGSVLSFLTTAAVDPAERVLVGGAVLQHGGFAVCELGKDVL